jgi:sugar phosphate isomerase/epimerase
MYKTLCPGAVGLNPASLDDALRLAALGGFQGLEINVGEVADLLEKDRATNVRQRFTDAGVRAAAWGLPTDWRSSDENWKRGLEQLPRLASAAAAVGADRTATYILSWSDTLPFEENRAFHIERFRPIAEILKHYEISLGLEFLGPKTLYAGKAHPFIHDMQTMLDMAAEIGPNVGLLLDCFHWYTARADVDDILSLIPDQISYVHVNDAPKGTPIDEQLDGVRGLPGETGEIDIAGFLQALQKIGYDGPVTPEPFKNLSALASDEDRVRVVGESMDKIFTLAGV